MIVCQCRGITDRCITIAVLGGKRTLGGVCRSTGAGRDCGACVSSVKRVITTVASQLESADARIIRERTG